MSVHYSSQRWPSSRQPSRIDFDSNSCTTSSSHFDTSRACLSNHPLLELGSRSLCNLRQRLQKTCRRGCSYSSISQDNLPSRYSCSRLLAGRLSCHCLHPYPNELWLRVQHCRCCRLLLSHQSAMLSEQRAILLLRVAVIQWVLGIDHR